MATRLCTTCGRFSDVKRLRKSDRGWKHSSCALTSTAFVDKVLCVVCGKANDEKNTRLRKSGFKCLTCVGKAHRPEVLAQLPEIKRSENKDTKSRISERPIGTLTVAKCVTCNLKLQVPSGATLLTCPSCKTIMNPYNHDLRFLKCTSCASFLQFSFSLARSPSSTSPFVSCGRCDTPNLIPSSMLNPTPPILPAPAPIVVRFNNSGAVISVPELRAKKRSKIYSSISFTKFTCTQI